MVTLQLVAQTDERLVFRMGALAMIGQMGFCIFATVTITATLILVLDNYFGLLAYVVFGFPGALCVVCGFIGCLNAKQVTFVFDRTKGSGGEFAAVAGAARLDRPFRDIRLIHIERERGSSSPGQSSLMGGPNTFAACLMFEDGTRLRLEGGVSVSASDLAVPAPLRAAAEQIREFLRLPQHQVAVLDVTKATKERKADEAEAHLWLSKWLACQALAPTPEPPLHEYDWVEPPEGVAVPPPVPLPEAAAAYARGPSASYHSAAAQRAPVGVPQYAQTQGATPVVLGRVVQQPRTVQVLVPPGGSGQNVQVQAPDGSVLMVPVPAGAMPGQTVTVQY